MKVRAALHGYHDVPVTINAAGSTIIHA
jgi:hypothetical protein